MIDLNAVQTALLKITAVASQAAAELPYEVSLAIGKVETALKADDQAVVPEVEALLEKAKDNAVAEVVAAIQEAKLIIASHPLKAELPVADEHLAASADDQAAVDHVINDVF